MARDRKKPRALHARRAAAAVSVAAALSLGGAMAWSETNSTTAKHGSTSASTSDDSTPHTSTGGS